MVRSLPSLEAFYWVVRLGGFQAAATRLGIAQPTVSNRVKELERRTGRVLLTRAGHRATPTVHGEATYEYAGRILGLVQDLEGRLRSGGPLRGVLRLGASDGFAMTCLGGLLKTLKVTAPELRIAITVGNSRALEGRLREGDLDLAILSDALETRDLRTQALGEQEIAWVASPNLELGSPLRAADLLTQQIFTNPPPSHLFSVLMDWFGASGEAPPSLSSCDSVAVIASLVTAGAGMSILPVCIVREQLAAGTLLRLDVRPIPPRQRIVAAWIPGAESRGVLEIVPLIRRVARATWFLIESDV
jgi:DNA-binding transcriptional LysR family regulator